MYFQYIDITYIGFSFSHMSMTLHLIWSVLLHYYSIYVIVYNKRLKGEGKIPLFPLIKLGWNIYQIISRARSEFL